MSFISNLFFFNTKISSQIGGPWGVGSLYTESMRFALEQIERNQLLPDYNLELKPYETDCSTHLAPKYVVQDIPESLNRNESGTIKLPLVVGPVCADAFVVAYLLQWSGLVGVNDCLIVFFLY